MRLQSNDSTVRHFLYSPASSYPNPYARLVDAEGNTTLTWSNAEEQLHPADDPPNFLRGWNHVELDNRGDLFAIVPLHCVLKLDRDSNVIWKAMVSAHHDLEILESGQICVLTEAPRMVTCDDGRFPILDNQITVLEPSGAQKSVVSLYDILRSDPLIESQINEQILLRRARFADSGWPRNLGFPDDKPIVVETMNLLSGAPYSGPRRRALQLLRQLPGSPCDIIHTNSIEVLGRHPNGFWQNGHVLVSLRNLDLIAVIDMSAKAVVWMWGKGEVSGQHQPSALPNGNVLVFDNGTRVGRSRIIEVNPEDGRIEWEYVGDPPQSFFAEVAGGCELLPNGNILVSEPQSGGGFELSRDREVVWRLRIPQPAERVSRATIYRLSAVPLTTVQQILRQS